MIRPCPKKWYGGKRQANTGSAGALARYEREARNSYGVTKFEIERAATLRRARAPALPVLTGSFHIGSTFWAEPTKTVSSSLSFQVRPISETQMVDARLTWVMVAAYSFPFRTTV